MKVFIKNQKNEQIDLNISDETNVLELLSSIDLAPDTPCGGKGICGKCLVLCHPGEAFSEPDIQEIAKIPSQLLRKGMRLACRTRITKSGFIELVSTHNFDHIQGAGNFRVSPVIPYKLKYRLNVPEKNTSSEAIEYVYEQLEKENLKNLSMEPSMISNEITVSSRPGKIMKRSSTEDSEKNFGIAIDIGTTTIAITLVNMANDEQIDTITFLNPQRKFGHDVISRITYSTTSETGFQKLREILVETINARVKELTQKHGLATVDIEQFVIAGNTTMSHFFFGFPVEQIAIAPYKPFTCSEIEVLATEFGEIYGNQAKLYGFPAISAFVGGDIVAGVLFIDALRENSTLFIDLGTNGEIVFSDSDGFHCCSTAAGPAFEGANISCGTGNIDGAIESINIVNEELEIRTIGRKKPIGICGTGLISIIAEFLRNGIIESSGRFNKKMNSVFLNKYEEKGKRFWLSDTIFVSQKDIRNFQLAKSALRTGIEVLKRDKKINPSTIKIAGGFSNGLRSNDLYTTGILPPMNYKVEFVGNTALLGCIRYLLDRDSIKKVKKIVEKAEYIELSNLEIFREMFVDNLGF